MRARFQSKLVLAQVPASWRGPFYQGRARFCEGLWPSYQGRSPLFIEANGRFLVLTEPMAILSRLAKRNGRFIKGGQPQWPFINNGRFIRPMASLSQLPFYEARWPLYQAILARSHWPFYQGLRTRAQCALSKPAPITILSSPMSLQGRPSERPIKIIAVSALAPDRKTFKPQGQQSQQGVAGRLETRRPKNRSFPPPPEAYAPGPEQGPAQSCSLERRPRALNPKALDPATTKSLRKPKPDVPNPRNLPLKAEQRRARWRGAGDAPTQSCGARS